MHNMYYYKSRTTTVWYRKYGPIAVEFDGPYKPSKYPVYVGFGLGLSLHDSMSHILVSPTHVFYKMVPE